MTSSSPISSEKELTSVAKGAGNHTGITQEDLIALTYLVGGTFVQGGSQITRKHYVWLVITGSGRIRMKVGSG